MRILLSTYGSRGDVEPLAALAAQLRAMGAEAAVSAPPDREFADLLARAGAPLVPAFMPIREWIAEVQRSPLDLPTRAAQMIAAQDAAIRAAAEGCDAVLATGLVPSAAAAQCVAERMGVPYLHATFCPLFLPSHHHGPYPYPGHPHPPGVTDPRVLWRRNVDDMNALFGGAVNAHRAAVGLPQTDNVRDHVVTKRPLLASDPVLWPWRATDLCDAVQTGAWILPDETPLPAELDAFLAAGAPPVYVGFGSMNAPTTKAAAEAAIAAIRSLGRRAVVARGWADATPADDRDDCFLVGEVNQQALFRRVAAVVHHGGAGTTTAAARAGAPQAIAPHLVDQPYWAKRVAGLGVGVALDGPDPDAASLAAALAAALAPAMRGRAAAVADAMPADGARIAARLVMEVAGAGGRR